MQPRIFLSHSSKDPALTQAVSAALETPAGDHPGYEVLVDAQCLQAGEEWPVQLHSMMAYAHAGLILLTRAAIARPDWVRNEAYILAWRRSLDPAFKLFYVLLDDVKSTDLSAAGFDPTHLRLIQAIEAGDPAGIAGEAKALGPKGTGSRTPFEELALKLAEFLRGVDPSLLGLVCERLKAPPLPWRPGSQAEYVERMAARLLSGQLGDYEKLSALINELKSLAVPPASLKIALRWMAPYWLPPAASGRFAAVVRDLWHDSEGGTALINGRHVIPYTAEMFVYKARPFDFQCRIAEIEAPAHKADAEYYKHQICEWLRRKMPDDYERCDDAAIVELLSDELPFLFVPLPVPVPDTITLDTLRAWFPRVVFLVWTGDTLPEGRDAGAPGIVLTPAVDAVREHIEYFEWRNAVKAMRG
jgi:hypothetical protein